MTTYGELQVVNLLSSTDGVEIIQGVAGKRIKIHAMVLSAVTSAANCSMEGGTGGTGMDTKLGPFPTVATVALVLPLMPEAWATLDDGDSLWLNVISAGTFGGQIYYTQ